MIENITYHDKILSIIIRANYEKEGLEFFTPDYFSQQLAYMNRPSGYEIPPHVHNEVQREVGATKEVLYIKSGQVQVDFYNDAKDYLESRILYKGDVILLAFGGHGFKMLENTEIIEVKQGPYLGDNDKTRFEPVSLDKINLVE